MFLSCIALYSLRSLQLRHKQKKSGPEQPPLKFKSQKGSVLEEDQGRWKTERGRSGAER